MASPASSVIEAERTENGHADSRAAEPVLVSAALPPDKIIRTSKIWSKLLHAAALPLLVGLAIFGLQGQFSIGLFHQAWPLMAALAAGYVGAWMLSSEFERYPFINQFEAALVSVSITLVPVGLAFAALPRSPINVLALVVTLGCIGWYLADKLLHRYRDSRLLVLPGGVTHRLLSVPSVSLENGDEKWYRSGTLDGIVADLHTSRAQYDQLLADCSMKGLPTYHAGYIYELLTARVLLGASCKTSVNVRKRRYFPYAKRAMDLVILLVTLPLTLPLMAVTALAIRLESPGDVLFWQERIGRGGETFQMVKFRSMVADNAGERQALFASTSDDRVTRVGRFIRKFRIDELPQFWNVLKGEMSLIGPRPEQVGLAEDFSADMSLYEYRHLVRPGITGWAQVLHGYAADKEATRRKLEHDLYYVKHQSLVLEVLIIYLTLKTILTGFGAR
jgi:lipopolysaccharide/colanic/teichoic acid biosynthesis glycosyltransferase